MANHHIQHHDILNKYPNKLINRYNYLILYCCVECYYFVNAVILRGRSNNYIYCCAQCYYFANAVILRGRSNMIYIVVLFVIILTMRSF